MKEGRYALPRQQPGYFDDDDDPVERRAEENPGDMVLKGYAAVFGLPSVEMLTFRRGELVPFTEFIRRGAFTKALRNRDDTRALVNHDSNLLLARTSAGTLELREDGFGLLSRIHVVESQVGRDCYEVVRRGDLTHMSFAFTLASEEWDADAKGENITRTIIEIDRLYDVAPVTFPAYESTVVEVAGRSGNSHVDRLSERYRVESGPDIDTMRRRLRMRELA